MTELTFSIRKTTTQDTQSIVDLLTQLDSETTFMLFEPGERKQTLEQQEAFLQELETSQSKIMLVAESETKLIGFIVGIGGIANRNRHSCFIVIGVLSAYWNQGIGRSLLTHLETWAKAQAMHRLELTVMTHNQRANALYEKCGFVQEGVKRHSMWVDGEFVDEFYMGKLL
jgi:RimJ/RimL family protein N-acetyltransferase